METPSGRPDLNDRSTRKAGLEAESPAFDRVIDVLLLA
jgi:hypothetical protein